MIIIKRTPNKSNPMMLPPQSAIAAAYDVAPQYVKDFIDGDDLTAAFKSLRTTHKLHLDDAATLATLMNAVMLELIPLGQFEAALAEHIPSIDQDTRTKITREVNEKVFAVLRTRAVAPSAPTPTPPPTPATPQVSVVAQKLSAPVTEAPKEVTVTMPQPEPSNPTSAIASADKQQPATNPKYSGGSDPYREPVE